MTAELLTSVNVDASPPPPHDALNAAYESVHGYLALGVCVAGAAMNACNVYVLTRHAMRASAVNALLFALSAADLAINIVYVPFALYFYVLPQPPQQPPAPTEPATVVAAAVRGVPEVEPRNGGDSGGGGHGPAAERFAIVSINMGLFFHTMSMWLTVAVTAFRYVYVRHYARARLVCSLRRARFVVVATCIAAIVTGTPSFVCFTTSSSQDGDSASAANVLAATSTPSSIAFESAQGDNSTAIHSVGAAATAAAETKSLAVVAAATVPAFITGMTAATPDDGMIEWASECSPSLKTALFVFFGGVVKMAVCVALVTLSALLVASLRDVSARRRRLLLSRPCSVGATDTTSGSLPAITAVAAASAATAATTALLSERGRHGLGEALLAQRSPSSPPSLLLLASQRQQPRSKQEQQRSASTGSRAECVREERGRRTTIMLVAVAVTFAAVEMPQGAVVLLAAVDQRRFWPVYVALGDLFDFLGLLKSVANFVFYATMSRTFRRTFGKHVLTPCRVTVGLCQKLRPCAAAAAAAAVSAAAAARRGRCGGGTAPSPSYDASAGAEDGADMGDRGSPSIGGVGGGRGGAVSVTDIVTAYDSACFDGLLGGGESPSEQRGIERCAERR